MSPVTFDKAGDVTGLIHVQVSRRCTASPATIFKVDLYDTALGLPPGDLPREFFWERG